MALVQSDEQLMIAYVAGSKAAFDELFARYAPVLLRLMLRELRMREEANDLVQQTFLQVHRARRDFDPTQRFKPWVFTIALNLKREYFRRRKRKPEAQLDMEVHEPAVDPRGQEQADASRELQRGLADLPNDQREVIELHWFEGLSFAEIAQCVGASVSAVKVRAHRGYVRLRGGLEGELPDLAGRGNPKGNSDI
jgi:RNA polymerase sigma-70 factor (ECF subfamily)